MDEAEDSPMSSTAAMGVAPVRRRLGGSVSALAMQLEALLQHSDHGGAELRGATDGRVGVRHGQLSSATTCSSVGSAHCWSKCSDSASRSQPGRASAGSSGS